MRRAIHNFTFPRRANEENKRRQWVHRNGSTVRYMAWYGVVWYGMVWAWYTHTHIGFAFAFSSHSQIYGIKRKCGAKTTRFRCIWCARTPLATISRILKGWQLAISANNDPARHCDARNRTMGPAPCHRWRGSGQV